MTNVFENDWRDCTEALFRHNTSDGHNIEGITTIMSDIGYNETDLALLRVKANMHNPDYIPADNELAHLTQSEKNFYQEKQMQKDIDLSAETVAHPAECTCAACMDIVMDKSKNHNGDKK